MADKPSPERVYRAIATILERRYNVEIEYTLHKKGEVPGKGEPNQSGDADVGKS